MEQAIETPKASLPRTNVKSGAWVDPLVLARLDLSARQRVLVELASPVDDLAQDEPPEDAPVTRTSQALLQQKRAALLTAKTDMILRLDTATPDTLNVVHWYPPFSLLAVDVTPAQIDALAALPNVARIHADREEQPHLASSLPAIAAPWFHNTRAAGKGTAVAVLDTPVRWDNGHFGTCPSPGAQGCAVAAIANFSSQTPQQVIAFEDANNKGSHGTNVAAIVHGVAPQARLLGLNVFSWNETDNKLSSRTSDQIEALAWVADKAATYDIVAVNMSIGGTPSGPGTCNDISRFDAIRTLWVDHGILAVVSSGNDGQTNAVASPGCLSMAVTVGAHFDTELDDYKGSCQQISPVEREIACFSNLSGMVDILAPGLFIDAGGFRKSGTSMAAPHVAGAVAAWQSYFLEDEGEVKTPFWMHKRLLVQSSAPHVHTDGRRYQRLDFDQSIRWDHGRAFPYWYREATANQIPSGSTSFETSMTVSGQGWDVHSAYLTLDLVHEFPQHVEVRVIAPNGSSATFKLPSGQAHFTGVVGRTILPGALSSLAGSPVDGKWTLRIRDTVGTKTGNYLQGALYFTKQGCTPKCAGETCGDDTCGGSCGGFCVIDGTCRADGEKHPDNACQACKATSPAKWTSLDGPVCSDGNTCTVGDRCKLGVCTGNPFICPAAGPCEQAGECNEKTGLCEYAPRPDGLTCSDDDPCTVGDACSEGECQGTPIQCTPGPCMRSSGCDGVTGECVFSPEPDGTPCDEGACKAGACVEGQKPLPVDGGTTTGQGGANYWSEDAGGCGCFVASPLPRWNPAMLLLTVLLLELRRRQAGSASRPRSCVS